MSWFRRERESRHDHASGRVQSPAHTPPKFTGPYAHRRIEGGIGHNLPQEAPAAFADAILELGGGPR